MSTCRFARPALKVLGFGLALNIWSACEAQTYLGADAAIRAMQKPKRETASDATRRELETFRRNSGSMSPEAAAKEWLRLARKAVRSQSADSTQYGSYGTTGLRESLGSLPGPDAWPVLFRLTHSGKPPSLEEAGLRVATSSLIGNVAAEIADLKVLASMPEAQVTGASNAVASMLLRIAMQTRDVKLASQAIASQFKGAGGAGSSDALPDLVSAFGNADSKGLIRLAITLNRGQLSFQGPRTTALARQVALENIDRLKAPLWDLTSGPEGATLRTAMERKFHTKSPVASSTNEKLLNYILSGDNQGAIRVVLTTSQPPRDYVSDEAWMGRLQGAGKVSAFRDVLRAALARNPSSDWWPLYVRLSESLGMTSKIPGELRAAIASPKVRDKFKPKLSALLASALLADDQIDAGIQELRKQKISADGDVSPTSKWMRIATIGHLLNRNDLVTQGLNGLKANSFFDPAYLAVGVDFLLDLGKGPEAEKLLIDSLTTKPSSIEMSFRGTAGQGLMDLVKVYDRAGRSADIVKLLDEAPDWPVDDLSKSLTQGTTPRGPTATMAARALAAVGRKAEALRVVTASLAHNLDDDPTFEVFTNLKGVDSLPDLDRMYEVDRFEERPLIWKAVVLQHAGRLEEAERTIRQAISVDPSDGETKFGHRMFGYKVLADILEARGDVSQAQTYRNALRAIRMSEQADDLLEAGLVKRAIELYQESLTVFSDAYCIQSRLAIQLAENGHAEEAAEHYRRAFELMPTSFGRVESHCFGCEGAFASRQAQKIAVDVLQKLANEHPVKAQAPYLLGYLRESQGNSAEALKAYRQAVQLDPDYLNAWVHLHGLAVDLGPSSPQAKLARAAIFRLDPLSRHSAGDDGLDVDYRTAWLTIEAALPKLLPVPEHVFPLKSSRQKENIFLDNSFDFSNAPEWDSLGHRIDSPSQAIARMGLLQLLGQILRFSSSGGGVPSFPATGE